jgi:hypothetical protein
MDFDLTTPWIPPSDGAGDELDASAPPVLSERILTDAGLPPDGSIDPFAIDALISHARDYLAGQGGQRAMASEATPAPATDPVDQPGPNAPTNSAGLAAGSTTSVYPQEIALKPVLSPTLIATPVYPDSQDPPTPVGELVVTAPRRAAPGGAPSDQAADHGLGGLSMFYETGFHPGQEGLAAARVSTGVGDPGGVSYGAFQLSSHPPAANRPSQVQDFLNHEGAQWATQLNGDPTAPNGDFGTAWKAAAQSQPDAFFDAQNRYIARTHFDPVVAQVKRQTGLDVTSRSPAVQDVVWSMAVQHGAAPTLVAEAVNGLKGVMPPEDPGYDRALINKLYDVRTDYVAAHHYPVSPSRYPSERRDALRMASE